VRARHQLEPLDDRDPIGLAAAEPAFVAHDRAPAGTPPRVPQVRRAGEEAGSDEFV
jgi:hypothetical protein